MNLLDPQVGCGAGKKYGLNNCLVAPKVWRFTPEERPGGKELVDCDEKEVREEGESYCIILLDNSLNLLVAAEKKW